MVCERTNKSGLEKFKLILSRAALSAVWVKVNHPLFKFHKIFGKITTIKTRKNNKTEIMFFKKTSRTFFSKSKKNKHKKK